MKRVFTLIITAFMLMITGLAWGQTRTAVTDQLTYEVIGVTGTTYTTWDNVTSVSDAVYAGQSAGGNSSIQLRSTGNNCGIVTTTSGGNVSNITITWNENTSNSRRLNIYGSNTAYTSPADLYNSATQGILLGAIVCGTSTELSVEGDYAYVGLRSASGAMYIDEIDITWGGGGTPSVATPTFNPAGGTYYEAQTVTIACTTAGASIYYTTNGTTPSTTTGTLYSSPITISETTTVKAIAVKEGMSNSSVASATYTIQDAPSTMTIAEARALADNEYALVQGVVTFIDARNVYIQDATAGIDLYLNSAVSTLALGDMVLANGKKSVYKGLVELTDIDPTDESQFSVVSTGNPLPMAVKTIAEILEDFQSGTNILQSTRVKIVDATIGTINNANNTPITQGTNTLNIYRMPVVDGLIEGDIVTVTGIIGCYNNPQLRVAMADDVVFSHSTTPMISANPTTLSGFGYSVDNGPSTAHTFTITGLNLTDYVTVTCSSVAFEMSLTSDGIFSHTSIVLSPEAAAVGQTIYVRMAAGLDVGSYSGLITIDSELDDITVSLSGHVTGPLVPSDYTRIMDISQLGDGSKVIFAARYNTTANEYFAMTAQASGKPEGVLFTSVISDGETLPSTITDEENTYSWTVGIEGSNYTFTNANGDMLGYTSSTNFANGGDNTAWSITASTSGTSAMVPEYSAFVVNNVNNAVRAIALNSNHNFGPYHTQNMNSEGYNFFIDMFVTDGGGTPSVAMPTFSPAAGTYYEAQTVTIACTTSGASIYYTIDGTTPSPDAGTLYSSPITISETTTVKAIAVKEGMNNSSVATATYIIQDAPSTMTIAEARALADNEYALVQGVVTFIDARNVYIQDATAGIDLYLNSAVSTLALGDMVMAYGKKSVYKGLVELSGIDPTDESQFSVVSTGNPLPMAVKTIAEILEDFQSGTNMLQSTRVKIVDATIGAIDNSNNTPITQSGSTLNIYRMPVVEGLQEGDIVTVTGIIGCYNNPQLRVALPDDVVFALPTYPMITANPTTLSGFSYSIDNGPSTEHTLTITGINLSQNVTVTCSSNNFEMSLTSGDGFGTTPIVLTPASGSIDQTIYVRMAAGLSIGSYSGTITIDSELDDITVSLSGNVTEPWVPSDYTRIFDVAQLGNGSKVIFAARYNDNANEYYAMTAQASGKPEGVLFTSVISDGETLPSTITDEENTYSWTVGMDGDNYTFTNANGDVLGYTSSTNFANGGDNTAWAITYQTSEASAMVPEYSAFVINNVNNAVRAFALNSNHNFGPYHTQNMNSENYNFFIDMFATNGGGTLVCATPAFTPAAGTYYETQEVTITCSTSGATIHYTTDGSEPTASSAVYSSPITVASSMTIKAIAMKDGYENSAIATAEYDIVIGAVTIFSQDWEGDMNGWTFVTVEGIKPWTIAQYSGNHYAYANGYNGGANEQWCISPAFNLNIYSDVSLSFRNAKNYSGPNVQLFFSNDYDGENPAFATWTELDFTMSAGSYEWVESGTIDLAGFTGESCYIGFKYTSTEDQAAAWEIDDVTLMGFTTEPYMTVSPSSLTGFTHVIDQGPSASQTFVLTAGNITPAPGGTTGSIYLTVMSPFAISLDNEEYSNEIYFNDVTNLAPTTVYVRMNGTEVGQYDGAVEVSCSDSYLDTSVTLSGNVTEQGQGGEWNRILSLADLHDGDQVIIAARYDATVGDGYYAMTAGVSGKPDGVLFTSENIGGIEALPASITNDVDTFAWTVTLNGDVITLTNAAGDMLGYSSSTNFAGNENTDWNIVMDTSGDGALIPNYTGFVITNGETTNRGIAKNASNKFGAYSTSNLNNPDYNFFLDLFVNGGSVTPTVATPVFSMASGTYYETIIVDITCATDGATIYYTVDGSDPTAESDVYEGPLIIEETTTVKAIAMMEGYDNSGIATANYVIMSGIVVLVEQDWEGDMDGWTFVTIEGNKPWIIGTYAGNKYANANGYGDDVDNEQWCISPAFNLNSRTDHNVILSFMNATKFTGPALELYFSNDYNGSDPTSATWEELSFAQSEGNYAWTESGPISLNAFDGDNCYIGFRYISTIADGAAAWEVDDIMIVAEMGGDPYLTATPNTLSGFVQNIGEPSEAQTFVLTGGNLPPVPGNDTGDVTLTVNNNFEISLDGEIYTKYSITIPNVVGTLAPTTVYVRLNAEEVGQYQGTITIDDYVEITVSLSGQAIFDDGIDETLASSVNVWNNNNEMRVSNSSDRILNMVVYNILGQPVLSETIATGSTVIRHDLAEGVYIVRISDGKDMTGIKVVVRR